MTTVSDRQETLASGGFGPTDLRTFIDGVRTVTGGRIRDFAADEIDGRIVLRGDADSFYIRQLVLCLARELPGSPRVVDRMRVATRPR
ncbi:MAG: BON domain-containing protein [Planctomycetota bacterium]